uniref:Uncharacterized protein n=1 Tax=Oryza punctata TaxID=4537 RepID=A0A0E0MEF1_ORYPU
MRTTLSAAPWAGPGARLIKEITFAAALLVFRAVGAIGGILVAANRVGSDRVHGSGLADLKAIIADLAQEGKLNQ